MINKKNLIGKLSIFLLLLFFCATGPVPADELDAKLRETVTLYFNNEDIHSAMSAIGNTYGINVLIEKDIDGRVTVNLADISLKDALDAMLDLNDLTYERRGNILKIIKRKDDAMTEIIRLNYAKADEISEMVTSLLSEDALVQVYDISNELIVKDKKENIDKVKEFIAEIDVMPRQVMIESKLLDIKYTDFSNLGVTWTANWTYPGFFANLINEEQSDSESISGGTTMAGPSSDLTGGQLDLTLAFAHGSIDVEIDALIRNNKAKVLAAPTIVTLNNKEAKINIGEKVPTKEKEQTTTGTIEKTVYQQVGIKLSVTPQITNDGYINMSIHPEVSSVSEILDDGPRITTREADTQVLVKDGETIIIAGLIHEEEDNIDSRIPILGDIPFIGYLFRNKSTDISRKELVILITPRILKTEEELKRIALEEGVPELTLPVERLSERLVVSQLYNSARQLEQGKESLNIERREKTRDERSKEAIKNYEEIAKAYPESDLADDALYKAAYLYKKVFKEYGSALRAYRKLARRYPNSRYAPEAIRVMRSLERRKKYYERLERSYDKKIQKLESSKDTKWYAGKIERLKIERDKARAHQG